MKTRKYIVVDDDNKPMSFDRDQFYYVQPHHRRVGRPSSFRLKLYTKEEAQELIKKHLGFRISEGYFGFSRDNDNLSLMPVA